MAKTPEENRPNINQSCEACGTKWTAMEILPCPTCAPATPAPIAAQTEKPWKRQESCSECDGDGCEMCDPKPKEQVDAARLDRERLKEMLLEYGDRSYRAGYSHGPMNVLDGEDVTERRELFDELLEYLAASLKQETQPPRCPSGAQSGTVTESQRCIECGQIIPVGAECFYYRETGIFVHRKCPASSSPLETPAAVPEIVCENCGLGVMSAAVISCNHGAHQFNFTSVTPAPADTGAAKITSKQDWPAHINVAALKAGAGMTYLESAQFLASTGDTPQPQDVPMFQFGGLLDAFDALPNDIADDVEVLRTQVNALRAWVEDYFDPERVPAALGKTPDAREGKEK